MQKRSGKHSCVSTWRCKLRNASPLKLIIAYIINLIKKQDIQAAGGKSIKTVCKNCIAYLNFLKFI